MQEDDYEDMIDGEDAIFGNEEKPQTSTNYSNTIEDSVLSSLIVNFNHLSDLFEKIGENDFYVKENKLLYKSIKNIAISSEEIDDMVLSDMYSRVADISPVNALTEIKKKTQKAKEDKEAGEDDVDRIRKAFVSHFRLLKTYTAQREKEALAKKILTSKGKFSPDDMVGDLFDISSNLNEIADSISIRESNVQHISKSVSKLLDSINKALNSDDPDSIVGVSTGFSKTDDVYSGYHAGDLVVLAGRPSMGKTAMSVQKMVNIAFKGTPVIFFSSEMPAEQISMRILGNLAKIDSQRIQKGQMSDGEWIRLKNAVKVLDKLPITIDDTNGITISEIDQRVNKWYNSEVLPRKKKDGIIFVDYLQIIKTTKNYSTTNERVTEISGASKNIARKYKVPLVMLSQLNRALEQRPNKRPMCSDLRDSGAIEQDADVIEFIYRDEVYNKESASKGVAELITAKCRNGCLGVLFTKFVAEHQIFSEIEYKKE